VATLIYAVVMASTMLLTPYTKEIKSVSVYLIATKALRFYAFQALLINTVSNSNRQMIRAYADAVTAGSSKERCK